MDLFFTQAVVDLALGILAPFIVYILHVLVQSLMAWIRAEVKRKWVLAASEAAFEIVLAGFGETGKAVKEAAKDGRIDAAERKNILAKLKSDSVKSLKEFVGNAPKIVKPWLESMIPGFIEAAVERVNGNPTTAPKE